LVIEEQLKLFDLPDPGPSPHSFKPFRHPLWTKHKATLISRYLYYFVLITRHGVYIDGFAGPQAPDKPDSWAAKLVLESEPKWMRNFYLCDVDPKQVAALKELRDGQSEIKGRTIDVFGEDFNVSVDKILETDRIREKTATFCLIDQRTFECNWASVEKIALRKADRKIELFYFVPTGWLARSIKGLNDPQPTMERWWRRDDWVSLRRLHGYEIADMFCQRFKEELAYNFAHAWPIYETQGGKRVMYYMVHASDHIEAPNLMARAYRKATGRKEPPEQFSLEFNTWSQDHPVTSDFEQSTDL